MTDTSYHIKLPNGLNWEALFLRMRDNKNVPKEVGFGFGENRIQHTFNRSKGFFQVSLHCDKKTRSDDDHRQTQGRMHWQ